MKSFVVSIVPESKIPVSEGDVGVQQDERTDEYRNSAGQEILVPAEKGFSFDNLAGLLASND